MYFASLRHEVEVRIAPLHQPREPLDHLALDPYAPSRIFDDRPRHIRRRDILALTQRARLACQLLIVGVTRSVEHSAHLRIAHAAVNFIVAACVVVYWAQRWFGYLSRGITWSASDQFMPLYAILVCVLAGGTLAARWSATTLNWLVFTIHAVVFIGAVLFVTFFRMKLF